MACAAAVVVLFVLLTASGMEATPGLLAIAGLMGLSGTALVSHRSHTE